MTPRQRFHQTMQFGRPDHPPLLEEGLRDDVLKQWHRQGLPEGTDLASLFVFDRRERIEVNLASRNGLTRFPPTRADLAAWRSGLDSANAKRLPEDWAQRVAQWRRREHILELFVRSGLFLTMGVEAWATLEPVLYFLADEPALAREMMDAQADFVARMVDRILSEVDADFVSFSEPIADNHGPLVSPAMYSRIVLPGYKQIINSARHHGVDTIVFMTYGNSRLLLPEAIAAGFNCLWAMETESRQMDYGDLRRQFGRELRLIGGIDLDTLLRDEAALDRELEVKVPPLLAAGGYIPLADGRVRASIPYRQYSYYRRRLEQIVRAHSAEL